MRKNPVLENEMKRYTRNMKCAWIILGVNLVLALFALIAQMGLSGRENYMTILQYRFPLMDNSDIAAHICQIRQNM